MQKISSIIDNGYRIIENYFGVLLLGFKTKDIYGFLSLCDHCLNFAYYIAGVKSLITNVNILPH